MRSFALHLMRHGEPVVTGRLLGRTDTDVTEAGIAACIAHSGTLDVTRIISSDLTRARRCAEAIGTPQGDPRWRELDFGDWDGLSPSEVDPEAIERFHANPDASPPPGGERWSTLVARVGSAIEALTPAPTLVVTHAGAMRAALAYCCGLTHEATWAIGLPYAAVLTLTVWEDSPRRAQVSGLLA